MSSKGEAGMHEVRGGSGGREFAAPLGGDAGIVAVAFAVVVAVGYYLANSWVAGPAYLADEIGYLNNAAFLAGHFVDGASSYYAGYSFLISPLFRFSSDPYWVWQGVLAVNAVLWGGTIWLLAGLLKGISPAMPTRQLGLVLALVALYPANVVMSGYAFSQSAVAFCFMLAVWTLQRADIHRPLQMVPHALAVGLLCWIHPIGFAVLAASILTSLGRAVAGRVYLHVALSTTVSVATALLYREVVDPWRVEQMTQAAGSASLHYPKFSAIVSGLLDTDRWLNMLGMFAGQLGALIAATFGLVLLGAWHLLSRERRGASRGFAIGLFVSLAVLGCIAISALGAAIGFPDRIDHWIYGRYVDPVMLPLLAFGLIAARRMPLQVAAAVAVSLVGSWLVHQLGAGGSVNWVNISGFWPAAIWPQLGLAAWFMAGGAGVLLASFIPRPVVYMAATVVWVISVSTQFHWHAEVLKRHSNPSEVVDFIRGNYPKGCIVFDTSVPQTPFSMRHERPNLYSFSFFSYEYKRSGQEEWLKSCDGPILTYDAALADRPGVSVVGLERSTGLRVMIKGDPTRYRYPVFSSDRANESYWLPAFSESCLVSGACLIMSAKDLARATQVGVLVPAGLATSGAPGYLFFGPYAQLPPGRYEVRVRGSAKSSSEALLDVASSKGVVVHASRVLAPVEGDLVLLEFELATAVDDVEVRLRVGGSDELVVEGYSLLQAGDRETVE